MKVFVLALIIIIVGILFSFTVVKPSTCWDHYQTEKEAILHCEGAAK
jgi:hypothetical protein